MCSLVLFSPLGKPELLTEGRRLRPLLMCALSLFTGLMCHQWRFIWVLSASFQGYSGKPRQLLKGINWLIYSFTIPSFVECLVIILYVDFPHSSSQQRENLSDVFLHNINIQNRPCSCKWTNPQNQFHSFSSFFFFLSVWANLHAAFHAPPGVSILLPTCEAAPLETVPFQCTALAYIAKHILHIPKGSSQI